MLKYKYSVLTLIIALIFASGCSTVGKPADIDPATGKIKTTSLYGEVKATVVKSDRVVLAKYKPLILTLGARFFKEQTVKIGYFDTVVGRQDMEQLLIKEGKSDIVTDVTNLLSWKKIADQYKPFLVLKPDVREEGRTAYAQLRVVEADTAADVFVAEVKMDFMWKGVNDDTVYYPLFNAFIDWGEGKQTAGELSRRPPDTPAGSSLFLRPRSGLMLVSASIMCDAAHHCWIRHHFHTAPDFSNRPR